MRPDPVVRLEGLVGPLGFEPRTDGLKVSGSSFKTAGKLQGKRRHQAIFQPKEYTCANTGRRGRRLRRCLRFESFACPLLLRRSFQARTRGAQEHLVQARPRDRDRPDPHSA